MDIISKFDINQSKKFTRSCVNLIKALGSHNFATDNTRKFTVDAFDNGAITINFPGMQIEDDAVDILHLSCVMIPGVKSEIPIIGVMKERIYTGTERIQIERESKQLSVVVDETNILGSQNLVANAICYVLNDHDEDFENTDNRMEGVETNIIPSSEELNFVFNLSAAISAIGPVLLSKNGKYLKITYAYKDRLGIQMCIPVDEGLAVPLILDITAVRDSNTRISIFIETKYDGAQSNKVLSKMEAHFATTAMEEIIHEIAMKLMNTIEMDLTWIKNNEF